MSDFKVGDQVFSEMKKLRGFVTRTNALGLSKTLTVGVHFEDNTRETFFGKGVADLKKL